MVLHLHRIHLCVTSVHTQEGVAEAFVEDVKNEVAEIMKSPNDAVEGKVSHPSSIILIWEVILWKYTP